MKVFSNIIFVFFLIQNVCSQEVSGDWTGQLKFEGNSLDLNFKIFKKDGDYVSLLSVPAQNLSDFKANKTSLIDSVLKIEIDPLGIKYQGKLTTTDKIEGNFYQNGMTLKLNFTRGNTKLKRPQEPQPPFDYYEEEVIFQNKKDNIQLSGTLTLPEKEGKFPVVILISGSGPQDRNSTIMEHKPFLLLAHELTQTGVGVLRYDERGVGQSEGEFKSAGLNDFINDVKSAYAFLKTRPEVDAEQIGLLGHSIGGIIAPKVAIQEGISFLILLAAPGIDGDQLMLQQRADFLKLRGLTETQIEKSNEIFKKTYDFIKTTNSVGQQFEAEITQFLMTNYADVIMEKELMAMAEQLTSKEILGLLRNRPSQYLEQVECPVLAIGGTKDFQVASKENLGAISFALQKGGNTNVEIKEFEGLNHLFQESETGDIMEYSQIEQTMSPKVLSYIKNWIKTQVNLD